MLKKFNTKPIAASMLPAMAEAVVFVGLKCDLKSILNNEQESNETNFPFPFPITIHKK